MGYQNEAFDVPYASELCIYLCGNSLGLQPRRTAERISAHLSAWATKAVTGHFKQHDDSDLPAFFNIDDVAAARMAPLVGASSHEIALMETLTANLHMLMASFYQPTKEKYRIILEGKAFPSDHVGAINLETICLDHFLRDIVAVCSRIPNPSSQL